jgi:hypothetical protein
MPVIGLNFTRLEASRSEGPVKGEIKVNSTPKIVEVKEITVQNLNKKALSMSFEFTTHYSPGMGEIKLEGNLLFLASRTPAILKKWNKDKSLPEDVSVAVLNHLFRRCLIKISAIADDLQLPPPVQLPVVKPRE